MGTRPSALPVVDLQQLLDDVNRHHDTATGLGSSGTADAASRYPFTEGFWGQAYTPYFSYRTDNGPDGPAPDSHAPDHLYNYYNSLMPTDFNGFIPWFELTVEEADATNFGDPAPNEIVEVAELGLAVRSKSLGTWRVLKDNGVVGQAYVWAYGSNGMPGTTSTSLGIDSLNNNCFGFALDEFGSGSPFGTLTPDPLAPGGNGVWRAHGWSRNLFNEYMFAAPDPANPWVGTGDANKIKDIDALIWWMIVRKAKRNTGLPGDTVGYRLMPGVDISTLSLGPNPSIATRAGWQARARHLPNRVSDAPTGPWAVITGHTMTTAMLNSYATELVGVVPGFQTTITPPPPPPPAPVVSTRDPLKWPFSKYSIWNMPIGSGAHYVPVGYPSPANQNWDVGYLVVPNVSDPVMTWKNNVSHFDGGRDDTQLPNWSPNTVSQIPANFVVPDAVPGNTPNNPVTVVENINAGILQVANTVCRTNTAANLIFGSPIGKYSFTEKQNLYGPGIYGGHGGSNLSGWGGHIKAEELKGILPTVGYSTTQDHVLISRQAGATVENIHIYGFGQLWPTNNTHVSSGEKDGGTTVAARIADAVAAGQEPMLTLACCPQYFRAPGGLSGFLGIEEAPDPAKFAELATELASIVSTYYASGVRKVQVWNELKGFWNVGLNRWDYEGYTTFYNLVYTAIKTAHPDVQVYGGYIPLRKRSAGHDALYNGVLIDSRDIDAMDYWLAHATGFDGLAFDGDFQAADWGKVVAYVRTKTTKPVIVSEFYSSDGMAAAAAAIKVALSKQDMMLWWAETSFGTFSNPYPSQDIPHALALNVSGEWLYANRNLSPNPYQEAGTGYRWPASTQDAAWASTQAHIGYHGTNPDVQMGSLLAIPRTVDITTLGLTPAGERVARALQNYGAYVVDTSGWDDIDLGIMHDAVGDLSAAGSTGTIADDVALDLLTILAPLLAVVTNNGPATVGGGGSPVVTLAPDFTYGNDLGANPNLVPATYIVAPAYPSPLDFGTLNVGDSVIGNVAVHNTGDFDGVITSITTPTDFQVINFAPTVLSPLVVQAGAVVIMQVRYTPTTAGTVSAPMSFVGTDGVHNVLLTAVAGAVNPATPLLTLSAAFTDPTLTVGGPWSVSGSLVASQADSANVALIISQLDTRLGTTASITWSVEPGSSPGLTAPANGTITNGQNLALAQTMVVGDQLNFTITGTVLGPPAALPQAISLTAAGAGATPFPVTLQAEMVPPQAVAPLLSVAVSPATGATPLTTVISASASSGTPPYMSYRFDFGDGTPPVTSAAPTISHTYTVAGGYTVMVTVTDTAFSTASVTTTVTPYDVVETVIKDAVSSVYTPYNDQLPAFTIRRPYYAGDLLRSPVTGDPTPTQGTFLRYPAQHPEIGLDPGNSLFLAEPNGYDGVIVWFGLSVDDIDAHDFRRLAIVRSGYGHPMTPNDGEQLVMSTYGEIVESYTNSSGKSVKRLKVPALHDTPLQPGHWYYYTMFLQVGSEWRTFLTTQAVVPVNYGHADVLWNLIPPFYQEVDEDPIRGNHSLKKFLEIVGYDLDFTKTLVEGIEHTYSADLAPMQLLRAAGQQNFGLEFPDAIGEIRYRRLVALSQRLFDLRGTLLGLKFFLETVSQYDADVRDGRNQMLVSDDSEFTETVGHWGTIPAVLGPILLEKITSIYIHLQDSTLNPQHDKLDATNDILPDPYVPGQTVETTGGTPPPVGPSRWDTAKWDIGKWV